MANVQALKDQLEEMGAQLAADPNTSADMLRFLFVWKAHQAAVAEEQAARPMVSARTPPVPRTTSVPRPKETTQTPFEARKEIILSAVRSVLVELGSKEPVKTAMIFDLLPEEIAKSVPGVEPKSNLSAMIHNSKRFISHGRAGWTLPETISGPAHPLPESGEEEVPGIH